LQDLRFFDLIRYPFILVHLNAVGNFLIGSLGSL